MGVGVGMMSEFYVGGCAGKWELGLGLGLGFVG